MACRLMLSVLCLLTAVLVQRIDGGPVSKERTGGRQNSVRVTEPPIYPPFARCDQQTCDLRTHYCDKVWHSLLVLSVQHCWFTDSCFI